MRSLVYGVAITALLCQAPAFADCAEEIAALEGKLAPSQDGKAPEAGGNSEQHAAKSGDQEETPDEVVDRMVEENSVTVEEDDGSETKFSGTGAATPTENWFGEPPEKREAANHLISAMQMLEEKSEQACMDEVDKAREALATEHQS
jgi:hypothetical protein